MAAVEAGYDGAPLEQEDSGWSMASGDVEQKYFVPLKMRKGDARDAVEILLRLSDYEPMTVMASVAEHLCTKYRQRYPNAELLLKRTLQACRSDASAMALHKRPWQPHQLDGRPDYPQQRSRVPPTHVGNGRAQTAPGQQRQRPPVRGNNNENAMARQMHQQAAAQAVKAREAAESGGRPWTVGGATSPDSERINHRGALASILPKDHGNMASRRPASRPAKGQGQGMGGFGDENREALMFPPLSAEVSQASGMDQEHMHAIRSKNPDRNMKQWMLEKRKKEMKREQAKKALIQKERKWIADLANMQTQRNKERRIMEERNLAATQIQVSFRGFTARKTVKIIKDERKRAKEAAEAEEMMNSLERDAERIFDD